VNRERAALLGIGALVATAGRLSVGESLVPV